MKRTSFTVLFASAALWSASAAADGPPPTKAACLEAASQAQSLRDAHKLLEARDKLQVCAQRVCPTVVQKDCLSWLEGVEQSLPTVVITAKDGTGHDLFDVKVTVDGQPLTSKLQGDALPLNPGARTLHFETADGVSLDQQVLVKEGLKNQEVNVVLGKVPPPPEPAPQPVTPAPAQPEAPPPAVPGSSPMRTVGWIAGGVGIVGLGVGTVFGFMAMSDKNNAHCDASGACDAGPLSSANSAATVSTIGIVAGGVLLAGGAALVLLAPKAGAAAPAASLRVAPLVGARDGGLLLGGSW